jgi:glycosyltransferase involved in cell wall biosynthesis
MTVWIQNKKPVVVYYTSTHFLDACLETIQSIKQIAKVHVIIEIGPESLQSNIVEVETIREMALIETPEKILKPTHWNQLRPYFEGTESSQFVVYKSKRILSIRTLRESFQLGKYLKKINPELIHFDTISMRSIGLYPYLRKKKIMIALHDAIPHTGEDNWKEKIPGWLYYKQAKGYIFYSEFSKNTFQKQFRKITAPLYNIQLQQYSYVKQFHSNQQTPTYILFFGRLSPYKGIDILLEAIPMVLKKHPEEQFIIAGKPVFNFEINRQFLEKYKNNIQLIERHIQSNELIELIDKSKFVVCPYREASQSGVLMTAFALQKSVVATQVGAFPEYIEEKFNGLLADPNPVSVAEKMMEALQNDKYIRFNQNINDSKEPYIRNQNAEIIEKGYQYCLH